MGFKYIYPKMVQFAAYGQFVLGNKQFFFIMQNNLENILSKWIRLILEGLRYSIRISNFF